MKAAVLGSGLMGSVISWDLSRSPGVDEVVVADVDPAKLKTLKGKTGKKLGTEVVDVKKSGQLAKFIRGFDVVASRFLMAPCIPLTSSPSRAGQRSST